MHVAMTVVFVVCTKEGKMKKQVWHQLLVFSGRLKILSSITNNNIRLAELYFIFTNQRVTYSRQSEESLLLNLLNEDVFQMTKNIYDDICISVKHLQTSIEYLS